MQRKRVLVFTPSMPAADPKEPVAIFGRLTVPLWKRPFAELFMKTQFGSSGHSRESSDDSKVPDCRMALRA
jgi:hypothetical protein